MILTIDIGNTTVGLCGLEEQGTDWAVCFSARMDTVPGRSEAEYRREVAGLLEGAGGFEGAALSSVVPALTAPLRRAAEALLGTAPLCVTAAGDTGLTLAVPEPDRVGLDRLADAAWAAEHYPLPAVTVDLGTATTFNVIDGERRFLGGIIAPGLATGLTALTGKAAQLPEIPLSVPEHVIGTNTEECMCAGAVAGTAALVDGLTGRIEEELGSEVCLILTGGLARYVQPLCRHPHSWDPYLLHRGLAFLHRRASQERPGPASAGKHWDKRQRN